MIKNSPSIRDNAIDKQRPDIAKLSPQKLSYFANKGVVKRAQKAIQQGDIPTLDITDDLTLTAQFLDNSADASVVTWSPNCAIYDSICSCPASPQVLCRHKIQTALAYRHYYCQRFDPETLLDTPAYQLSAKQISTAVTNQTRQQVQRTFKSAIDITLSFTDNDPCAMARLSMATVHFWGGNALHECTCDCKTKLGCEHIILAAIAFAKQSAPITTPITVSVSKADTINALKGIEINSTKASQTEAQTQAEGIKTHSHKICDTTNSPASATTTPTKTATSKAPFTFATLRHACRSDADSLTDNDFMPSLLAHTLSLLTDNETLLFSQLYHYGINGISAMNSTNAMHNTNSRTNSSTDNSTDAIFMIIDEIYQDNKRCHYLWLNDILLTLKDWLVAYRTRRSDFELRQGTQLISEYLLRRLAGQQPSLASVSLGVGIKAQTDMRPMQLISLGCRLSVYDGNYQAQTLLLDNKTQTPLLLQSTWQRTSTADHAQQQATQSHTAHNAVNPIVHSYLETRQQRIATRITLAQLQHGQLNTQRSRRSANHSITLNKSRAAYNQLMPYGISAETLAALPAPLYFSDTTQLRHYYRTRPLSFARARHQQPNFVILPIHERLFIGYDAAKQTVGVLVQTANGTASDESHAAAATPYWIKLNYRSHSPFALALLAQTFDNSSPNDNGNTDKTAANALPHHVSGTLSWERFGDSVLPVITPWAIFCQERSVVLALDLPERLDSECLDSEINWQDSPALSKLPLVDFSQSNHKAINTSENTSPDLIYSTLENCKNWLDEALIYGAERLPHSVWQKRYSLMRQAQQAGLKQLAASLKMSSASTDEAPTTPLSTSEYLLMLAIQLTVLDEIAAVHVSSDGLAD